MTNWILIEEAEKRIIADAGDARLGRELLRERLRNGDVKAQATYLVVTEGNTRERPPHAVLRGEFFAASSRTTLNFASIQPEFFRTATLGYNNSKNYAVLRENIDTQIVRSVHKMTGAEWNPTSDETDDDEYQVVQSAGTIERVSEAFNVRLLVSDLEKCWPVLFSTLPTEPSGEPEAPPAPRKRSARGKGGSPTKHAWAEAAVTVAVYLYENSPPARPGPLKEVLKEWFALNYEEPPDDSSIGEFDRMILDALKKHLNRGP